MDARDRHRTTTTITTAARLLGVSVETLRKRLQRGTIEGYKADDGTWRVVLDMSGEDLAQRAEAAGPPPAAETQDEILAELHALREQVTVLAEASRDLAILLEDMHGRLMSMEEASSPRDAEDLEWPDNGGRSAGGLEPGEQDDEAVLTPAQARRLLMAVLEVVERQGRA